MRVQVLADVVRRGARADHDARACPSTPRRRRTGSSARTRPCEVCAPGICGICGKPDMPVASTRCFGRSVSGSPFRYETVTSHSPPRRTSRLVHWRRAAVVELHHLHVHLEPVAHAVLRREHRPVLGKRQVRHVVVPHRVVQAERGVALAPGVAGALVLLHHHRRHAEALQARGERDAALPAADDERRRAPCRSDGSRRGARAAPRSPSTPAAS